jgi:hypothetical protein
MTHTPYGVDVRPKSRIVALVRREIRELIPPMVFFFLAFNLMLFTKKLILAEYEIEFYSFIIATISAFIVPKVVLVIEPISFWQRFDRLPIAYNVLVKSIIYSVLFTVVRLIEPFVHYLMEGGVVGRGGFLAEVLGAFTWPKFIYVQLWVFLLFILFFAVRELNSTLKGGLVKIFFSQRHSDPPTG